MPHTRIALCITLALGLSLGCSDVSETEAVEMDTSELIAPGHGLRGEYFGGTAFGTKLHTRTDATVDFVWRTTAPEPSVPATNYSVRWTGYVEPRFSETYTFTTRTDDGVRLWVDGKPIVNDWTLHAVKDSSGTVALARGKRVSLTMEYFQGGGGARAQLLWASAHQPAEIIPSSQLYLSSGAGTSAISSYPISTVDALARPNSKITELTGRASTPYQSGSPGADRTFDLRSWSSSVFPAGGNYPLSIGKSSPGARTVVVGGRVVGTQSSAVTWKEMKERYDGAGLLLFAQNQGDWMIVDGARFENQMDDFRPRGAAQFVLRNVWSRNTRDDVIENDSVFGGLVHDSLFESAFVFLSEQNGTWDRKYDLELSHLLVRLAPQAYDTDMDGDPPVPGSVVNGKGHSQLFKHFSGNDSDTPLRVHDCLFYVTQRSLNGDTPMSFPSNASYENVTLLYTGGGKYPGKLPASGVTEVNLTTHSRAEIDARWAHAVAKWKTRHGVTDFDNVDMSKFIYPDPF